MNTLKKTFKIARQILPLILVFGLILIPLNTAAASTPPSNVQAFINTYLAFAQEQYQMYGVPVSVALAQSGIETAWGSSQIMVSHNNFFAITSDVNSPRATGTYQVLVNGKLYTYTEYSSARDAWLDFGYFLTHDPNYAFALPYINQPRIFYQKIYCMYTQGVQQGCDTTTPMQIWDNWTSQYDSINTSTVNDIANPDTYSCLQPGYVDFEGLPEGTNLSSGTIAGMQFTTTNGYSWLVGDFATGNYNGKYPDGGYTSQGTHWAWLGITQGAGRIDFPKGLASYFSLLVSNNTTVYVDAYNASDEKLATAGPSQNNYNTGHMTELKITRATADMAYVMVHDEGNYFEIDSVCTDAPGTPNTINRIVDQTYFMQTGQHTFGNFIVNFVPGARQFLHIFLGPFFSDVDLKLTRPNGTVVSPNDPGVTFNKTTNSIEVTIDDTNVGEWQYEIIANQLDQGGEDLHIIADEESILTGPAFNDAPADYWAWEYIERLYGASITGGCSTSPLNYCPENEVTRAQMAIFLERGVHYPYTYTAPNVTPTFNDTVGHWAEDWIEALKNDGITAGCATGLYCPENPVTRAQMAVFLLKAKYGSSYTPPAVGASTGFGDVPTDYWASAWIKQLAAETITSGCGGGNYCPDDPVTRAQMAVFLVKTFSLP